MKLVLSVEAFAPQLSGIGRYTWELAQRLPMHEALQEVSFYRSGQWVSDPAQLLQDQATIGIGKDKGKDKGKSPWPKWPKLPRWARQWRVAQACGGKVFHGPNFFVPPFAEKAVITVHDLSVFKFPQTHPVERVQQFERDFSRSVAQCAQVITDCETIRQELILFTGLNPNRVTAVPLGVAAAYKPRTDEELQVCLAHHGLKPRGYALCVSTVEPRKKIEQLLDAWEYLPAPLRLAFPLILVGGTGWLDDAIQLKIQQGAAKGWVRHLGYVSEADLPGLYAGAAVFVYPSTYEGFGLPPIEAMACGVPVVVARQSCLAEVTQGAALLAEPDDVPAFAALLEKSLLDESWRLQAAVSGRAVAAGYTWSRCVDETVKVYQRAVTGGYPDNE